MSLKGKWRTLKVMKFAPQGQKRAKLEEDVTKVAPSSMKAPPPQSAKPPPAPPSTFGSDRREAEGESKGKEPEGKGKQKGKSGAWRQKGGKESTQVDESDYDRRSQHKTQTARESAWGAITRQEGWGSGRYQDPSNWEVSSGEWRWGPHQGKWGDVKKMIGFGEYAAWSYGDVMTYKEGYAEYLIKDEADIQCPSKKFAECLK